MTAPDTLWAVTEIAHPALRDVREDCPECLALTAAAITNAAVTGSTGSTYTTSRVGGEEHSVTVTRAVTVTIRRAGGETGPVDETFTPQTLALEPLTAHAA